MYKRWYGLREKLIMFKQAHILLMQLSRFTTMTVRESCQDNELCFWKYGTISDNIPHVHKLPQH